MTKISAIKPKKVKVEKSIEEPIAFEVFKANGMFVRSYSVKDHGENAEKWAQNFIKGTNMTYKPINE